MVCGELKSKSVVKVPHPWHIIFLVLNVIFPGLGTILSACCGSDLKVWPVMVGLVQMFTSFLIIGWLWSIWWGWLIFRKSD